MRVALLHQHVPADAAEDELDVLQEAETVRAALVELGHEVVPATFSLDLAHATAELRRLRPDLVFNLVESVEGSGRLLHLASSLLDFLGFPYSGCPTEALFTTSNKPLAKTLLRGAGLPTPDWLPAAGERETRRAGPWLIKSVWEHASVGLGQDSLVQDAAEASARLRQLSPGSRQDYFAEAYIEGREFNMSVLAGPEGPEVLPSAEIVFLDFPEGKPRIVDYRAKWDEESFEYQHTVRNFDFPATDTALLRRLQTLCMECWQLFGLRGYARVDFRVDTDGDPWILEVNANPCISEGAGFLSAAARAGLGTPAVISRILNDSLDEASYGL